MKKGFLLAENVIKIVIALICIIFLVYLLFSLYYANEDANKLKQADASLDALLNAVKNKETEVQIYNPLGSNAPFVRRIWFVFTWPTKGDSIMPKACSTLGWEDCVCICGVKPTDSSSKQSLADVCDQRGICKKFDDLKLNKDGTYFSGQLLDTEKDLVIITAPYLDLNINYDKKEITKNGN